MATQEELDQAVVDAAGVLSVTLSTLDEAEGRRKGFRDAKQDADANLQVARADVQSLTQTVKADATTLTNAITAANAGPTP